VRRADWLVLVAAALLRAGSWFNPLVWLACRRLRHESERACDDMVLQQGVDGADYATHLVDIARTIVQTRRTWVPAPAVAHPSTLEQRIRAMLNPRCDRTSPSRLTRVAATMTLSCAALIVAAARCRPPRRPPSLWRWTLATSRGRQRRRPPLKPGGCQPCPLATRLCPPPPRSRRRRHKPDAGRSRGSCSISSAAWCPAPRSR
jgi:hypothetical protein